jgi:hypothetical protein
MPLILQLFSKYLIFKEYYLRDAFDPAHFFLS